MMEREIVGEDTIDSVGHALFENAEPRQGMPDWPAWGDSMTVSGLPGWRDLSEEAKAWWRQMVVGCIQCDPRVHESEVTHIAMIRSPNSETEEHNDG